MALVVTIRRRRHDAPGGRFGGGWQWAVGAYGGGRTLIVNLLVLSIRFTMERERDYPGGFR